jgi:hypothetical protein
LGLVTGRVAGRAGWFDVRAFGQPADTSAELGFITAGGRGGTRGTAGRPQIA